MESPRGGDRTSADRVIARVRSVPSEALTQTEIKKIRRLLGAAFAGGEDGFTDADWQHSLGGRHCLLEEDGEIRAHAVVVTREIHVDDRALRTGYVEAVGVAPRDQGKGFGTTIMRDVTDYVRDNFELGALSTGRHHFYERLGWVTWKGPLYVRTPHGLERTPDDEGDLMVLVTPQTPALDLSAALSCDWRSGDVW